MATIFSIEGPFEIPCYEGKGGRTITEEDGRTFWDEHDHLGGHRGCYVFGIRAGKGLTPGYVGKATRGFRQEVFSHHKLTRYQQFLADYGKGTPVLFFVVAPRRKGAPNAAHIRELEEFLIQVALAANSDLLNIKGTRTEEWGIGGVLRSGKGKPSSSAREFRRLMKLGV